MATKDTIKAAQTLLSTFGPVVEALPEVLNLLSKQDEAERRVAQLEKDYNKLVDTYNKQLDKIESADRIAVERANQRQAEFNKLESDMTAAVKDLQAKQRELTSKITAKRKEVEAFEVESVKLLDAAKKSRADALSAIQADHATQVAQIEARTEEAQKKHDDTVKKLEALKAKL